MFWAFDDGDSVKHPGGTIPAIQVIGCLKKLARAKGWEQLRRPICVAGEPMTGNIVTRADRVYRLEKL
jgi:hypothetical protein